jgi:hypothetical protein
MCLFSALEGYQFQQFGGSVWDFTFHQGRGSQPFPGEMSPAACLWQPRGSAKDDNFLDEFGLQNFLTTQVKEL